MRTVDFSEVLYGAAALAGMRPDDLASEDFALFRTFLDRRLQKAWEIEKWPDICPIEQRWYRQWWDAAVTYVASDERFDRPSGKYFQSLQAANLNNPPTIASVENAAWWAECKTSYCPNDWAANTDYAVGTQVKDPDTDLSYQIHTAHTSGATIDLTKMGLLTPFNKFIAYEQTDETAIGEYFRFTNRDPRTTTQLVGSEFWLSEDGAQFTVTAPNTGWLYFRKRRPVFTGEAWDSEAAYVSGNQVYYAATTGGSGNFYTANTSAAAGESPATNPAKWDVIEVPYFLRGYLIQAGFADWLISDGQTDKAAVHENFATEFLEAEADKLQRQQGQAPRFLMRSV